MAGPVNRTLLPDVLDGSGELIPTKTRDILYLIRQALSHLKSRLDNLTTEGLSISVSGAAGMVFIDTTLTADDSPSAPSVADDTVVVYTYLQSNGGGWVVNWPAEFVGADPQPNLTDGWETTIMWRKVDGPIFKPLRSHGAYLLP